MENKVLATINGREVTQEDLNLLIESLGPQRAGQFASEEGQQRLLEELVNQELFYAEAVEKEFDKEEAFQAELERMKVTMLKQYAMRRILNDIKADEEEVAEYYNKNKERFVKPESVRASHILVDNEEKAKEILAEINSGLAFDEAANKYSSCPSKQQGGDLGDFTKGRMVPEFENAAFSMNVGEVSEPVQTQFGYHIIKVTDKTPEGTSTLEEVKPQLTQQLVAMKQNKAYLDKSNELKAKFEVKIMK